MARGNQEKGWGRNRPEADDPPSGTGFSTAVEPPDAFPLRRAAVRTEFRPTGCRLPREPVGPSATQSERRGFGLGGAVSAEPLNFPIGERVGWRLCIAMLAFLFVHLPGVCADVAALNLSEWIKERPRIRELVARRTQSDGRVIYLLLVADGSNYVVKTAPSEKLLRARVLTPEVDVAGRCGDELWVARGRMPGLRFLRDKNDHPQNTNYVNSTLALNHGVSRLGLSYLYFGVEPLQGETQVQLIGNGFEMRSSTLNATAIFETSEAHDSIVTYQLVASLTTSEGHNVARYRIDGVLHTSCDIPSHYALVDLNSSGTVPGMQTDVLLLKLTDSPIPLSLFRPEAYLLEGFPVVMRLEGGHVVSFSASSSDWRKIVLFGMILPYRLVKWSVIALVAATTVVTAIHVNKRNKRR